MGRPLQVFGILLRDRWADLPGLWLYYHGSLTGLNKLTASALQVYRRRNAVLVGLGFVPPKGSGLSPYDLYLASPLWAEIRERKLAAEGRRCFACGKVATQVHHGDYGRPTLAGPQFHLAGLLSCGCEDCRDTWRAWLAEVELYAVCATDHGWAEHFLGEKLPPRAATKRLKARRAKNRLDERAVPRAARLGRQERKAREMELELARLNERDEEEVNCGNVEP